MRSKVGRRLLQETPPEIKIFVRKYAQIIARVHELLAMKGLNQGDLARLMDKSPSEISRWLHGEHNLTLKSLAKLEAELGDEIFSVHPVAELHKELPRQSLIPKTVREMRKPTWMPLLATISQSPQLPEFVA